MPMRMIVIMNMPVRMIMNMLVFMRMFVFMLQRSRRGRGGGCVGAMCLRIDMDKEPGPMQVFLAVGDRLDRKSPETQGPDFLLQKFDRNAEVNEGAEQHVAADTGETIKE